MENNKYTVLHTWLLPLLFVLGCFAANYMAGTLDYRNIVDERSQRDFNAALGMPLVIGFLWLALRILHRRSGQLIADFLVQINQLSQYENHMRALEMKLVRHVVVSASLAISITIGYLSIENLLALDQEIAIVLLNAIAVPFWFFLFLFVMQSASFTRYLYKRLVLPNIEHHFCECKPICDLGCSNVIFSTFMFLLMPLFWLGKEIPVIDILMLFVVMVFMFSVLFLPVFKTLHLMRRHRIRSIISTETEIADLIVNKSDGDSTLVAQELNRLNQQLEDLRQHHCWPKDVTANTKVFAISTGLPCGCLFLTWFLQ
ncbi:hypothetical protein [Alteromonas lipolytica]|uniref:Uncharacterized protein n=1 Tax=Alteromonas lipolytica TaxID=1856405 RepID=A0A1E8FAG5_9ALTE|nr:hypothetical protein [Alteromonas lipolytica]OFI32900.1 hypothetical protein BFC17_01090 [Alteromonas lipolytica]GGF64360.1 hypothetical protein GCM10011338_15910 [Alteromonas lipolytica]